MQWPVMSRNAWMLEWMLSLRNPSTKTTWFKSFFELLPRASLVMVLSHLHWAILNPGFQMTSRSVQHDLKCPRSLWGFFHLLTMKAWIHLLKEIQTGYSFSLAWTSCLHQWHISLSAPAKKTSCDTAIFWQYVPYWTSSSHLVCYLFFHIEMPFFGSPHMEWSPHQALVVAHNNPKRTCFTLLTSVGGLCCRNQDERALNTVLCWSHCICQPPFVTWVCVSVSYRVYQRV